MRSAGAGLARFALAVAGLLAACTSAGESFGTATSPSAVPTSLEPSIRSVSPPASPVPTTADADPAEALTGRAIVAVDDGEDVILRIGKPGWTLPGELVFDVFGDRVLSAEAGKGESSARLIVRDAAGNEVREIDVGFNLPQTGIIRGDDVLFAGMQVDPGSDPLETQDQGVWLARGGEASERIVEPVGAIKYEALHRSPNGRTFGVWRCADACVSVIVRESHEPLEIPLGLTALTDEAAVVLTSWSGIAGHDLADGSQRWTLESQGVNWSRYAMADGRRIVHATLGDDGNDDGDTTDEFRVRVIDATTGTVELTVRVPLEKVRWALASTLSTDRFAVLVPSALIDPDDAPIPLRVIDLADGATLDVDLSLLGIGQD